MRLVKAFVFIVISTIGLSLVAQVPSPAPAQSQPIVLLGGTIHVGNGEVIENGAVAFDAGKLSYVGTKSNFNAGSEAYKEIDASGKQIYPGLIMVNSILGLSEVGAIKATKDFNETGRYNPSVRSIIAYNAESEVIANGRSNGILLAQISPIGGVISGTSSVVQLDAWNWEDAVVRSDIGIHVNWPSKYRPPDRDKGETEIQVDEGYKKALQELEKTFKEAKVYMAAEAAPANLNLESMRELFTGESILFINVSVAREMIKSIQFFQKLDVKKIVMVGASDAYYVKEFLKQHQIPVILDQTHRLPSRTEEPVYLPYQLPGLLSNEDILVTMAGSGKATDIMNLPFFAGTTAAFGLSKEEALQLVTVNPARILGIDDRVGSLEVGKDATIVVSNGDLLDMKTNNVTMAFIEGRSIDLDNKHKKLYRKYSSKYNPE